MYATTLPLASTRTVAPSVARRGRPHRGRLDVDADTQTQVDAVLTLLGLLFAERLKVEHFHGLLKRLSRGDLHEHLA